AYISFSFIPALANVAVTGDTSIDPVWFAGLGDEFGREWFRPPAGAAGVAHHETASAPEPHLRRQVANPWHSSPYTFNNTQETQDFNGFAKVPHALWVEGPPQAPSPPRWIPSPSYGSAASPDTPAIASTSKAGARPHRLGFGAVRTAV